MKGSAIGIIAAGCLVAGFGSGFVLRPVIAPVSASQAVSSAGLPAAVSQVDGRHWITVEGRAVLRTDAAAVADAERRYAERYKPPRANPRRVVIEIAVGRVLGSV